MTTKIDFDYLKVDPNKPVVFLDMCGVLGDTWLHTQDWAWDDITRFNLRNPPMLGDATISAAHHLLIDIFKHYEVQVVIVSSWVRSFLPASDPEIQEFIKFLGYDIVLGSLSTPGGKDRSSVIRNFVTQKKIYHWVVIDDSKEQMYTDKNFFRKDRFVKPTARYGFWLREAEELCNILENKPKGRRFYKPTE